MKRAQPGQGVLQALEHASASLKTAHSATIGAQRDLERARAAHERAQATEETARRAYDAARAAVQEAFPAAVST